MDSTWLLQPTSPTAEPLWVSTKTRTTTDLVTSCVVTLIVCVWTAVHLNVPSYEERTTSSGWYKQAMERLKWMTLGLFAPEIVLWTALDQFLEARAVALELAKIDAVERGPAETLQSQRPRSPSRSPGYSPPSQRNAVNDEETRLLSNNHPGPTIDIIQEPEPDKSQSTSNIEKDENVIKTEDEEILEDLPSVLFKEWVALADIFEMHYRSIYESRVSRWLMIAYDWLSRNTAHLSGMHCGLTRASFKFLSPIWGSMKQWITEGYHFCFPPGLEKGFYVLMGGYEVHLPDREISPSSFCRLTARQIRRGGIKCVLFNGQRRAVILGKPWTLTSEGAISLAWMGLLPNMRPEEIKDKSKADSLTKTLVCLQASWMILQCISRKAQGLPVTLLEVNTVMHVVCALLMYLFWLRKAQGVTEPTLVSLDPRLRKLLHCDIDIEQLPTNCFQSTPESILVNVDGKLQLKITLRRSRQHKGTEFDLYQKAPSKKDIDGLREFLMEKNPFWPDDSVIKRVLSIKKNPFFEYAPNFPTSMGRFARPMDPNSEVGLVIATVMTALYGGVHMIPWNGHFATHLERIMWRASGVLIASGGLLWLIWRPLGRLSKSLREKLASQVIYIATLPVKILDACLMFLIFPILVISYILARVYMVAEAFASLRSLPVGSYEVVNWADMIPHF